MRRVRPPLCGERDLPRDGQGSHRLPEEGERDQPAVRTEIRLRPLPDRRSLRGEKSLSQEAVTDHILCENGCIPPVPEEGGYGGGIYSAVRFRYCFGVQPNSDSNTR